MRYYLYLDKIFLKSLFAAISETDFDIEIVEFSTQKSYSTTQDISLEPTIEKVLEKECEDEKGKEVENKKESENSKVGKKNKSFDRDKNINKIEMSLDQSNTYQTSTSRRYINIDDISEIKNDNFYHKLVDKLYKKLEDEENMCYECGCIYPYRLRSKYETQRDETDDLSKGNKFFRINNTYVWVDSTKLEADLMFLSNITDRVHVLGYNINNNKIGNFKIAKAIAIYIE